MSVSGINAADHGDKQTAIEPAGFEVSPQQRRLWLLKCDSTSLSARIVLELIGSLDIEALKCAIDKVVARHEILRTTFRSIPGRSVPVQVVHDTLPVQWRQVDVESIGSEIPAGLMASVLDEDGGTVLDLERGPLFRATLLRLQPDRHLLGLCIPSLCADSASLQALTHEMAAFYAGDNLEQEQELLQYADLSDWQNQMLENENGGQAGHAYWRQQKFDSPAVFLPCEKSSNKTAGFQPASISKELDSDIVRNLRDTADREALSLSSLLASGWQMLISRLSGMQDVLLYHASNGRTYDDLDHAIGPLARWLPLQIGLESSTPIKRLWRRTNRSVKEAIRWEHYWNPDAHQSDGLFDHFSHGRLGFQFEESVSSLSAGGLRIIPRSRTCITESFKLLLSCLSTAQGITLEFRYDSGCYASEEVHHLADNYVALLHSALQHLDSAVGALNLLSAAEREQILVDWNRSDQSFDSHAAVHQLFEEAARRSPQAVALVFEHHQVTHSQLNARANQLAHLLIQRGVGPDVCVGLYLPRGVGLIVGLLGILKAGGAYVPLDPALPRERLEWMLADSGALLLVTQTDLEPLNGDGIEAVYLDCDAACISENRKDNPTVEVAGDHLVYVIYTSGSTGRPKGVAIEHRNLLNYIQGILCRLDLPTASSFATVSTIAADLGNTTVFASLCSGGCLHIISQECAVDPGLWRSYWGGNKIDCLKIVPSHLAALLGTGEVSAELLPRRALVLGGEASSWEFVQRINLASPELHVLNHYGPTETTVGVLTYAVTGGIGAAETASNIVPLGRPLPNTRVYVLNDYLQPVPIGMPGEIYIGGAGVGRGYLNQTELNSAKFVEDPFCSNDGTRLYRTGDIARYLPDGNIEFMGRIDDQVKIRGYRIELGEIESVLLQHPSVRSAVVMAREDTPGDLRLVGYVVFEDGRAEENLVREYLRTQLPEYMVPSALVELARLPLTPNGKINRKELPTPEAMAQSAFTAPRNAVEKVLAEIWEELLRRNTVSVFDNFFEIGGHSLLATQVISRIRETFQIEIPLRELFEAPSVAAFGERLLHDSEARPQIESMAEMLVSLVELSEEELDAGLAEMAGTVETG